MSTELQPWQQAVVKAEPRFRELNIAGSVNWETEANFVKQIIGRGSEYVVGAANKNPASLMYSVINIAAIGLTLNPAEHLAYLVPRDGDIKLDISYRGLIKLATDSGSITWARADMVYESDFFEYRGPAEKPRHTADPFANNRGEFKGVYCIAKTAKTAEGDVLTEVMSAEQIHHVRDTSMAYVKKKKGPWVDWFDQMAKKAVIKRASKTWPRTASTHRLDTAIDVVNEHEGLVIECPLETAVREHTDTIEAIRQGIAEDNIESAAEAWHELSEEQQNSIWKSPTMIVDGKRVPRPHAPFTKAERDVIKYQFNQYHPGREAIEGELA